MLITPIFISVAIALVKMISRRAKTRKEKGRVVPLMDRNDSDDDNRSDSFGFPKSSLKGHASPPAEVRQGNSAGDHGSGAPTMADFMALKAELDNLKAKLNRYEGIWGWERPF